MRARQQQQTQPDGQPNAGQHALQPSGRRLPRAGYATYTAEAGGTVAAATSPPPTHIIPAPPLSGGTATATSSRRSGSAGTASSTSSSLAARPHHHHTTAAATRLVPDYHRLQPPPPPPHPAHPSSSGSGATTVWSVGQGGGVPWGGPSTATSPPLFGHSPPPPPAPPALLMQQQQQQQPLFFQLPTTDAASQVAGGGPTIGGASGSSGAAAMFQPTQAMLNSGLFSLDTPTYPQVGAVGATEGATTAGVSLYATLGTGHPTAHQPSHQPSHQASPALSSSASLPPWPPLMSAGGATHGGLSALPPPPPLPPQQPQPPQATSGAQQQQRGRPPTYPDRSPDGAPAIPSPPPGASVASCSGLLPPPYNPSAVVVSAPSTTTTTTTNTANNTTNTNNTTNATAAFRASGSDRSESASSRQGSMRRAGSGSGGGGGGGALQQQQVLGGGGGFGPTSATAAVNRSTSSVQSELSSRSGVQHLHFHYSGGQQQQQQHLPPSLQHQQLSPHHHQQQHHTHTLNSNPLQRTATTTTTTSSNAGGSDSGGGCGGGGENRLRQRTKQIAFGKVTPGYQHYREAVPLHDRQIGNHAHPSTPDINDASSKRRWDLLAADWRRTLHLWDEVTDPSRFHVPGVPTAGALHMVPIEAPEEHRRHVARDLAHWRGVVTAYYPPSAAGSGVLGGAGGGLGPSGAAGDDDDLVSPVAAHHRGARGSQQGGRGMAQGPHHHDYPSAATTGAFTGTIGNGPEGDDCGGVDVGGRGLGWAERMSQWQAQVPLWCPISAANAGRGGAPFGGGIGGGGGPDNTHYDPSLYVVGPPTARRSASQDGSSSYTTPRSQPTVGGPPSATASVTTPSLAPTAATHASYGLSTFGPPAVVQAATQGPFILLVAADHISEVFPDHPSPSRVEGTGTGKAGPLPEMAVHLPPSAVLPPLPAPAAPAAEVHRSCRAVADVLLGALRQRYHAPWQRLFWMPPDNAEGPMAASISAAAADGDERLLERLTTALAAALAAHYQAHTASGLDEWEDINGGGPLLRMACIGRPAAYDPSVYALPPATGSNAGADHTGPLVEGDADDDGVCDEIVAMTAATHHRPFHHSASGTGTATDPSLALSPAILASSSSGGGGASTTPAVLVDPSLLLLRAGSVTGGGDGGTPLYGRGLTVATAVLGEDGPTHGMGTALFGPDGSPATRPRHAQSLGTDHATPLRRGSGGGAHSTGTEGTRRAPAAGALPKENTGPNSGAASLRVGSAALLVAGGCSSPLDTQAIAQQQRMLATGDKAVGGDEGRRQQ